MAERKSSTKFALKTWDQNGEEQTVLEELFLSNEIKPETWPSEIKKKYKVFDPFTTDTFRNHFNKTRTKLGFKAIDSYLILVFIVSIILLISVASIIRCLRTRGATRALALPISPLSDDQTPLNAEPDIAVPMLSVQTPGCAGMERLGVPARSVPTRDDINHRRTFPHHDLMISTNRTNQSTGSSKSQQSSSSSGTSRSNPLNSRQTFDDQNHQLLCSYNKNRCPHHIALPDGERGPDRDFQIRTPCQQEEIPRTYVKAPPNKTIKDVPDAQCYHLHSSASSCNLNGRGVSLSNLGNSNLSSSAGKNDKSNKPLSLFKYFLRINNGGSNNNNHHSNSNNSQNHKSESHHSLSTFGSKSNNNNNMSVTPATSLNNMVLVNGGLGFNGSTNHSILHSNLHNNLNNYTTSATATSTTSFRTSSASGPGATTSTTVGTTELSSSISSSSSTSSGPEKSSNNFL